MSHGSPPPGLTYLDNAATTPLRAEAFSALRPFLEAAFGNPSGSHCLSRQASGALEEAREKVASCLGVAPGEVVFTGSGTEADNLAIAGTLGAAAPGGFGADRRRPVVVCSAIEHPAVMATCLAAARPRPGGGGGAFATTTGGTMTPELRVAPVGPDGRLDLPAFTRLVDDDVVLVSVMAANNEVGTIQPMEELIAVVRRRAPRAVVHSDAVQAAPWLDLGPLTAAADLVALSAHKFGGPKGMGVLTVRSGVPLPPLIHGGGQERERRSGTQNVAGAVGTAAALEVTVARRAEETRRVAALRDRLADGLQAEVPGLHEAAPRRHTLPGHLLVWLEDVEQEDLLVLLDEAGVCASGGSACASGALSPSAALLAMGLRTVEARGALRLTLGYATTERDVDRALEVIPAAVGRLRQSGRRASPPRTAPTAGDRLAGARAQGR